MASNNFINECKNRANANRLGKIIVDGFENPITNSDNLQSFSIDSGCYIDGNIIGSVYVKCLKANFVTNINSLVDKSIQAKIGVKYADLSDEYISVGKYTVERPKNEITANMSEITAYSELYTNLDTKYVCSIDYSSGNKTLKDLYLDVCTQLGLTPKTAIILNGNIPITDNPFTNGEKNRTVLQTVAKIACSFTDIDVDNNKIDLCWLSTNTNPDYTFYKSDYVSVEGGQAVCGPINCLVIKNSQVDDENVTIKDEESIEANGEHSIIISEDYILHNAELRQQAITAIWNRVKGMKYVDCKLTTYYGKPFLKIGNWIRVYTSDTDYFDTYVLKHKFDYDGSFASVIESPALTEQEIKTKQDIGLKEVLSNTQIDINKQKKQITSLVSEVEENDSRITTVEQTVDKIQQKVDETVDLTRMVTGIHQIELENCCKGNLLKLSITGEFHLLYPNDNLFPNANLFPIDSYISVINADETSTKINLPIKYLNSYEGVSDEFVIDNPDFINGRMYVIRRVGISTDGNRYILPKEVVEDLGNFDIPIDEGNNTIVFDCSASIKISATYAIKTELTDIFATKVDMNTAITQTADQINLEVSKKVDENEVISSINQSAEEIQINASKISLEGKEINLTSENINIASENFNVDKNGTIKLNDDGSATHANLTVISNEEKENEYKGNYFSTGFSYYDPYASGYQKLPSVTLNTSTISGSPTLQLVNYETNQLSTLRNNLLLIRDNNNNTASTITPSSITSPTITQTSLQESKKNFEKLENSIDILKGTDIYKYNLKSEKDGTKKHIGFVIGSDYNYRTEITSISEDGVDLYSMVSTLWQIVKELYEKIEQLEKNKRNGE